MKLARLGDHFSRGSSACNGNRLREDIQRSPTHSEKSQNDVPSVDPADAYDRFSTTLFACKHSSRIWLT